MLSPLRLSVHSILAWLSLLCSTLHFPSRVCLLTSWVVCRLLCFSPSGCFVVVVVVVVVGCFFVFLVFFFCDITTILFYSVLGCILPLQEVTLRQSPPTYLSFAIFVHITPCCPTISSLQRRFGLQTGLKPFICHSVLVTVHLLSFILGRCIQPISILYCEFRLVV